MTTSLRRVQDDEGFDADKARHRTRLAFVTRQSVEDQDIIRAGRAAFDEGLEEFQGDGELRVCEQRSREERPANDLQVGAVEDRKLSRGGGCGAQLSAEIEVMALPPLQAASFEELTQRCLAGTRRSDEENRGPGLGLHGGSPY